MFIVYYNVVNKEIHSRLLHFHQENDDWIKNYCWRLFSLRLSEITLIVFLPAVSPYFSNFQCIHNSSKVHIVNTFVYNPLECKLARKIHNFPQFYSIVLSTFHASIGELRIKRWDEGERDETMVNETFHGQHLNPKVTRVPPLTVSSFNLYLSSNVHLCFFLLVHLIITICLLITL